MQPAPFIRRLFFSSALALFAAPGVALAHAIVGDRIFPATIAVDDPGVNDELDTQVGRTPSADGWTTNASAEFDKRLTENFQLSVAGDWLGQSGTTGFDDWELGAKYTFFKNADHEAMLSAGVDWEIGDSGARRIADHYSTWTPTFYFGKGLGDLPDSMDFFKPLAVTGTLGYAIPSDRYSTDGAERSFNPDAVEWGATLQYSLPYLQQHVKDMGLTGPFAHAIPVVEFVLETPTGGDQRESTGSVNPGVLFMGDYMQVGFEAVVPVNHASGDHIGGIFQLHFYLDNLYPGVMRPLW